MAIEPFLGTRAQRAFLGTIVLQGIIVLAMVLAAFGTVEHFVDTNSDPKYKTIPCYLALFGLAEIFEVLMALDALNLRNIIQLVGILVFQVALIAYAAIQVREAHTAFAFENQPCTDFVGCDRPGSLWRKIEPFLVVAPCVIAASWLILIFFVRELFAEFGWAVFHVIGANPISKTMYQWYQILICLLKFDFFIFTGVTMQLLIIVIQKNSAEFGLTIAAIPVALFLLLACALAVKREVKWLMTLSLVLMLASQTYFYKLVRYFSPDSEAQYETTRITLSTFTIIAIILLFLTFAVGLRCFSDFDKGLREAKMQDVISRPSYSNPGTPGFKERQSSYIGGGNLTHRISIE